MRTSNPFNDPFNITKYDRDDYELERFVMFAAAVAGKTASTTEKAFEKMWQRLDCARQKINSGRMGSFYTEPIKPLELVYDQISIGAMGPQALRDFGFGCYRNRFRTFRDLGEAIYGSRPWLDLRTCSTEDLEKIHGIGQKTSRFFILHSRPDAKVACLDRHILRWMGSELDDSIAPRLRTGLPPRSKKEYLYLEKIFLRMVPANKTVAEFDLELWKRFTKSIPAS